MFKSVLMYVKILHGFLKNADFHSVFWERVSTKQAKILIDHFNVCTNSAWITYYLFKMCDYIVFRENISI